MLGVYFTIIPCAQTRSNPQPFNPSAFISHSPSWVPLPFFNKSHPCKLLLGINPLVIDTTLDSTRGAPVTARQINSPTMPPYAITPFKDLCLVLQPLNPHLRPMPAVCITSLPLKDKRDHIWADPCCLQCAKLVGSVDLFCVLHPNKNEHRCIRCFNLNITCVPIPQ